MRRPHALMRFTTQEEGTWAKGRRVAGAMTHCCPSSPALPRGPVALRAGGIAAVACVGRGRGLRAIKRALPASGPCRGVLVQTTCMPWPLRAASNLARSGSECLPADVSTSATGCEAPVTTTASASMHDSTNSPCSACPSWRFAHAALLAPRGRPALSTGCSTPSTSCQCGAEHGMAECGSAEESCMSTVAAAGVRGGEGAGVHVRAQQPPARTCCAAWRQQHRQR